MPNPSSSSKQSFQITVSSRLFSFLLFKKRASEKVGGVVNFGAFVFARSIFAHSSFFDFRQLRRTQDWCIHIVNILSEVGQSSVGVLTEIHSQLSSSFLKSIFLSEVG